MAPACDRVTFTARVDSGCRIVWKYDGSGALRSGQQCLTLACSCRQLWRMTSLARTPR